MKKIVAPFMAFIMILGYAHVQSGISQGILHSTDPVIASEHTPYSDTLDYISFEVRSVDSTSLAVYAQRKFEMIVTPRDKYWNIITRPVHVTFSARFPDEFRFDEPRCTNIFQGVQTLNGETAFYLVPTKDRQLGEAVQQLMWVTSVDQPELVTYSDYIEVRRHAPKPFKLLTPTDGVLIVLQSYSTPTIFTWEESHDPVEYIKTSRYTNDFHYDSVRYTVSFLDSATLTHKVSMLSDALGRKPKLSSSHGSVHTAMGEISACNNPWCSSFWFVEATDGLYITHSNAPYPGIPQIGNRLSTYYPYVNVEKLALSSSSFLLHQNYPNPFNPSTTIRFEIVERGHVTLRVYNLLGNQVAELANETLDPGVYSAEFNASGLASGVYTYILQTGYAIQSKQMIYNK